MCKVNPSGFQWFDLMDQSDDEILSKSLIAEQKLNLLIDEVLDANSLDDDNLGLVGFSQGCMISLQTALKRKKIKCVIGYSGKLLNPSHMEKNIYSRPEIYLMHGEIDGVVPINALLEAKEFLRKMNIKSQQKYLKNASIEFQMRV